LDPEIVDRRDLSICWLLLSGSTVVGPGGFQLLIGHGRLSFGMIELAKPAKCLSCHLVESGGVLMNLSCSLEGGLAPLAMLRADRYHLPIISGLVLCVRAVWLLVVTPAGAVRAFGHPL
jgi:hypothetical protein